MNLQQTHPDQDKLLAYQRGELDPSVEREIELHLSVCNECCERLGHLPDTIVSLLREEPRDHQCADDEVFLMESDSEFDGGDDSGLQADGSGVVVCYENESELPPATAGGNTAAAMEDVTIPPASEQGTITPGNEETQAAAPDASSFDLNLPPELAKNAKYRVLELLGRGGMGDVYKAEHRMMHRTVALKLINSQLVKNKSGIDRFHREVQAAARLSHPNIVTAYDAEQAGDVHFLVMEYVDGVDLAQVIRQRGPLPVAESCDYIRQASAGLQHAFEQGMVHRDIKPQNLMVTGLHNTQGQGSTSGGSHSALVKILDFGLANFAAEGVADETIEVEPTAGIQAPQLTLVGAMMGTPDYMAPEQAEDAHSADIRADIYSLGCTLYCALTGKAPFAEGSVLDKVIAHSEKQARPLAEFRDDVPDGFQAVLSRMMAKSLDERFQTPAEVIAALDPFINPQPEPEAETPRIVEKPSRSPLLSLAIVAGLLFAFCGGLGGVIMLVTDQGRIEIRSEVDDVEIAVRRGGKEVAILDLQTGTQVRWFATGEYTIALKGDRNDVKLSTTSFTLSRWGKTIVSVDKLNTLPLLNGRKPTIYDNFDGESIFGRGALKRGHSGGVHYLDASNENDGRLFAWYQQRHEFNGGVLELTGRVCENSHASTGWIVNLAGRVPQPHGVRFTMMGDGRVWIGPQMFDGDPSAGPRARQITHAAIKPAGQWNRLRLAMKGDTVEVWMNDRQICSPIKLDSSITPGKVALGIQTPGRGNAGRVEFDSLALWDAEPSESIDKTAEIRRFVGHTDNVTSVAFTPDGRYVASGGSENVVRLWDVQTGKQVRQFTGHSSNVIDVAISPDGKFLLSCGWDKTIRLWDIATGQQVRQFSGHTGAVWSVAFSHDGRRVLSGSGGEMKRRQWTAGDDLSMRLWDVESGEQIHEFDGHDNYVQAVAFSPDGTRALSGCWDGKLRLWDVEQRRLLWETNPKVAAINDVAFSPDGRLIISGGNDSLVRIWDAATGAELRRFEGHASEVKGVAWSLDSSSILSASKDGTVRLWDATTGRELQRLSGHTDAVTAVAFSPDGEFAASGSFDNTVRLWRLAENAPPQQYGEWLPLFNGKDLTGWKTHPDQPTGWKVENGMLIGSGDDVSHLFTERDDFQDFHLRGEVKINRTGNSGIFVRCTDDLSRGRFPAGYEAQIAGDMNRRPSGAPDELTGSLYGLQRYATQLVQADQWFTLEMIAVGNRITIMVNGQVTAEYIDTNRTYTKGHIALQKLSRSGPLPQPTVVQFRKIEIREPQPASPILASLVLVHLEGDQLPYSCVTGVVTNHHGLVVLQHWNEREIRRAEIELADGRRLPAEIVASEDKLLWLKADDINQQPARIADLATNTRSQTVWRATCTRGSGEKLSDFELVKGAVVDKVYADGVVTNFFPANGLPIFNEAGELLGVSAMKPPRVSVLMPIRRLPELSSNRSPRAMRNSALKFEGTGGGVEFPVELDLSRPFTIEGLFQREPWNANEVALVWDAEGLANLRHSGRRWFAVFRVADAGREKYVNVQGDAAEAKHRVHVAFVHDGKSISLFLDGQPVGTAAAPASSLDRRCRRVVIAGPSEGTVNAYVGYADEVRISNTARYDKTFVPPTYHEPDEHTLALYHFDEAAGDVLNDATGKHHGRINGGEWVTREESGRE